MPATLVDVAEKYVVLRPFTALGGTLQRGEVLDCSDWRNVQPLVNTRRLAPIWSPEARSALPIDFDFAALIAGADEDVADVADVDEAKDGEIPRRRPGRPRKEVA